LRECGHSGAGRDDVVDEQDALSREVLASGDAGRATVVPGVARWSGIASRSGSTQARATPAVDDVEISDEDMKTLRNLNVVADYGDHSVFPVFAGVAADGHFTQDEQRKWSSSTAGRRVVEIPFVHR
jgi:hypothetical protein